MCAHTIYVAAKNHFAHKKNKKSFSTANNREILGLIGTRSKPKKKLGFFAAYQTGHSYINLMRSFEFFTLLKILGTS